MHSVRMDTWVAIDSKTAKAASTEQKQENPQPTKRSSWVSIATVAAAFTATAAICIHKHRSH